MLAVRLADEAVEIGPAHATKSYLNKEAVVAAAIASGADAVHPGYGFLAENADFAEKVEAAGLIFVGPRPETIRAMGDKATAREMAARADVRTCRVRRADRGRRGRARAAARIGYPLMIKAAAGGGGRGIRVAETPDELKTNSRGGRGSERRVRRRRSLSRALRGAGAAYRSAGPGRRQGCRSISTSANARSSGVDRKCGRKRPPLPHAGSARSAVRLRRAACEERQLSRRRHARISL